MTTTTAHTTMAACPDPRTCKATHYFTPDKSREERDAEWSEFHDRKCRWYRVTFQFMPGFDWVTGIVDVWAETHTNASTLAMGGSYGPTQWQGLTGQVHRTLRVRALPLAQSERMGRPTVQEDGTRDFRQERPDLVAALGVRNR